MTYNEEGLLVPNKSISYLIMPSWQWRHNGRDSVLNHQPHYCLLNCLFRLRSNKTSKLHVTGLCAGNSPVTGEFTAQRASYAENVSIWWRQQVIPVPFRPTSAMRLIYQFGMFVRVNSVNIMTSGLWPLPSSGDHFQARCWRYFVINPSRTSVNHIH